MKAKTQLFIEKGALTIVTLICTFVGMPWIGLTVHEHLGGTYFGLPVTILAGLSVLAVFIWFATRWWYPREDRLRERIKVEEGNG